MLKRYSLLLVLFLTACEASNYLAVIEVSEEEKIVVNGNYILVEELADKILYIAQTKKLDSTQIKNSKIKLKLSSKTTVGKVVDIKEQLVKLGIQSFEYSTLEESESK